LLYGRIIKGVIFFTLLFAQADKSKEQSRSIPKKFEDGHILEQINYQNKFNRGIPDTFEYTPPGGWRGQFPMYPGDAMFTVFQMPDDGTIKGVNIPIYEWGLSNEQLTISLHKMSYPFASDGTIYPSSAVDSAGWLGGYDMDSTTGWMSLEGTTYTLGGSSGVCDTSDLVVSGAQDPLGTETALSGPPGTPLMGLLWPDELLAAIMTPSTHPDFVDGYSEVNWFELADYGSEVDLLAGEWVGILVESTGPSDGGYTEGTTFFYASGDRVVDPWVSGKFFGGCGGTSGNGGWHIRSWIFNFQLAAEFSTRPPVIYDVSDLPTTLSTDNRTVSAQLIWGGGPDAGVASATIHYQIDSLTAPVNNVEMRLVSGESDSGIWEGEIPGQDPGTYVYWYLTATNPFGATSGSAPFSYQRCPKY